MLVKYWQAAFLAVLMSLAVNAAWAQDCCKEEKCPPAGSCPLDQTSGNILKVDRNVIYYGQTAKCECGKGGDCCCDKKCECDKGCKCGKGCAGKKNTSCGGCCVSRECKEGCKCESGCECCGCKSKDKQVKKAVLHGAIIIHVPVPMMMVDRAYPMVSPCPVAHCPAPVACGPLTTPVLPPPPMLTPPGLPVPTMTSPIMPPQTVVCPPPACCSVAAGPVCLSKEKMNLSLEHCLSLVSIVSDLCCAHLQPNSLPAMFLTSLGMLMDVCPPPSAPVVAVPPASYVNHPPQYIPPSPPFPSAPANPDAYEAVLPPPRVECPSSFATATAPASVMPCASAAATPTGAMMVQIAAKPNSDQLGICIGADNCLSCKRMVVKVGDSEIKLTCLDGQVRVRGEDLKARADSVRTDRKGSLVLEGGVVLNYKKDGQSARISAEHVEMDLASGAVTVKSVAKSYYTPERVHGGLAP